MTKNATPQAKFEEITALYDMAGELLETLDADTHLPPEKQLAVILPMIEEIELSTDVLTEEYGHIIHGHEKADAARNKRVEGAFRRLYTAIENYSRRVQEQSDQKGVLIGNVADKMIANIKAHVGRLVVIFMEVLDISLHLIMSKSDAEELKQREQRVNLLLHNISTKQH